MMMRVSRPEDDDGSVGLMMVSRTEDDDGQ